MPASATAQSIPWEGTWDTNLGLMNVNANGSGELNSGDGTISGQIDADGTFKGSFTQKTRTPSAGTFFLSITGTSLGRPVFGGNWFTSAGASGNWTGSCVAGPCHGDGPSTGSPGTDTNSCSSSNSSKSSKHKKKKAKKKKKKKRKRRAHAGQADVCQDLWSAAVWEVDDPRFDHLSLQLNRETNELTGTYDGGGTLTGTVTSSQLGGEATGTFTDHTGTGTFRFKLIDSERFEGTTSPSDGITRSITATRPTA